MALEQYSSEIEKYLPPLGRIFLGAFFLFQGVTKVMGGFSGFVSFVESVGLPASTVVAGLVIAIEIGGGLALLAGIKSRAVSMTLAVYLVLINLIVHQFWMDMEQLSTFMKNLAVIGGLLLKSAAGPDRYSLENFLR